MTHCLLAWCHVLAPVSSLAWASGIMLYPSGYLLVVFCVIPLQAGLCHTQQESGPKAQL